VEDVRLKKIEDDLNHIAKSLAKLAEISTDHRLLEQRVQLMDKELRESFHRIHHRVDKLDEEYKRNIEELKKELSDVRGIFTKLAWIIIIPIITGLLSLIILKG